MCLAEFAATYVVNYERSDCDALPAPESDVTSTQKTLTDNFGKIKQQDSESTTKILTLEIGIERNSCCTILGLMSKLIY